MPNSTTARFQDRKEKLGKFFVKQNLVDVWRNVVRKQLRTQDLKDLYDHYDFNYNIENVAKKIIFDVLNGKYKPDAPLIFKKEKKFGICRHIVIPSPHDSLVLQTIVEHISPQLKDKSPSDKAYYSRDKHTLKLPHEKRVSAVYPWIVLWKAFQKDIFKFSNNYEYLVVTDVANYYDNIDLKELRNVISSSLDVDEAVLDILFNMIEELMWVPDYLPKRRRGLPTINLECIRLLAHVFLFEVDQVVKVRTKGSFVRWMDDINFGCSDKIEATSILSEMNDVLKSRGLALNLSKTQIYKAKDAKDHFLFDENKRLNEIKIISRGDKGYEQSTLALLKSFKLHLKKSELLNWDKVAKRYFTIAGKMKSYRLLKFSFKIFQEKPGLRSNVILYLKQLGFKIKTSEIVLDILKNITSYDDVTVYNIVNLLTDWNIPRTKVGIDFVKEVNSHLKCCNNKFQIYCYLWFATKYVPDNMLLTYIVQNKDEWLNDSFLCRQVASVLPRIIQFNKPKYDELCDLIMATGIKGAISVIVNHKVLHKEKGLNPRVRFYLFPSTKPKIYPLPKMMILLNVLASENIRNDASIKGLIKEHVNDAYYKRMVNNFLKSYSF